MSINIFDRVQENATVSGADGNITLTGAVAGFLSFSETVGVSNQTYYGILVGNNWEIGIGTLTNSTTLTRDSVLSSSNNNNSVIFASNSSATVFIDVPASKRVQVDMLATVATSGNYSDLENLPTLGSASSLNVGLSPENVVQLDSDARLPAVDGSQLTNLPDSLPTLTASKALVSDGSGHITTSSTTSTELSYVSGTTSNIQTQINSKADTSSLATVATSGNFNDLSSIPSTPTLQEVTDAGATTNSLQSTYVNAEMDDTNYIGSSTTIYSGDGSALTGISGGSFSLPIQATENSQTIIENVSSNILIQIDENGNIEILNSAGAHVFSIVDNQPQLLAGNLPGYEGSIISFDSNNNPLLTNVDGDVVFGVDGTSGRPTVNNNIYPANAAGALTNDGSGNLSWVVENNNLPLQTLSDPAPVLNNAASNALISTDSNGQIQLSNTNGAHILAADSGGNPMLLPASAGFDNNSFIGFNISSGLPEIVNPNNSPAFSIDADSFRAKIDNNVWPSDSAGLLTNDGSGNLSWNLPYRAVNTQSGTTYTLSLGDQMVTLNNTSAITVTIPTDTFPLTAEIDLVALNTGVVSIIGADGVSILSYLNNTTIAGQYAGCTVKQIETNTWLLIGNLA